MIHKIGEAVQARNKKLVRELLMKIGFSEHEAWQYVKRHMSGDWRND